MMKHLMFYVFLKKRKINHKSFYLLATEFNSNVYDIVAIDIYVFAAVFPLKYVITKYSKPKTAF